MKWNPTTRRHFLQGSGKAALVLPFLPSLLPRSASAAVSGGQKNFIGFPLFNGLQKSFNYDEKDALAAPAVYMPAYKNMQTVPGVGPFDIHQKTLTAAKNDSGGQISEIIDAAFNPYLGKMLMWQGIDRIDGHMHNLAHFGNSASFEGANPDAEVRAAIEPQATIDQVLAHSDTFCKSAAVKGKSLYWINNIKEAGYGMYVSHTYVDPNNKKTGAITHTSVVTSADTVWSKYFDPAVFTPMPGTGTARTQKQLLVDKVLADYQAVRGGSRLGVEDRKVMARHIELLFGTQKALNTVSVRNCSTAPAKPGAPAAPMGYDQLAASFQAMNSVVVALIACGFVHSFMGQSRALVSDDLDTWHAWSHAADAASQNAAWVSQKGMVKAFMKEYVLDMVKKLDAAGVLDDSLVAVIDENARPHDSRNLNIVTFGSAGGTLKTDQYIDYRNMAPGSTDVPGAGLRSGFPLNQAYATILQALGLPAGEFEGLNRTKLEPGFWNPVNSGYSANMFGKYSWIAPLYARFKGRNLSDWLPLTKA